MERERQDSNSKRAYGIVRDEPGPSIEVFRAIVGARAPLKATQLRVNPDTVPAILKLVNAERFAGFGALDLDGVPILKDERVGRESAIVVFPTETRVPQLVFWVWGEAAKKGATR